MYTLYWVLNQSGTPIASVSYAWEPAQAQHTYLMKIPDILHVKRGVGGVHWLIAKVDVCTRVLRDKIDRQLVCSR